LKDLKKKLIKRRGVARRGAAWRGVARRGAAWRVAVTAMLLQFLESFKNVFITFLLYGANWP
jgi:hypothetical protein